MTYALIVYAALGLGTALAAKYPKANNKTLKEKLMYACAGIIIALFWWLLLLVAIIRKILY
jgi:hypothetical protein